MDAVTPKGHGQREVAGHSHIVRPAEMEWKETSFPGCWAKPLYVDHKNGIATLLMKFDPGAVLPDHEHVLVEQTYVLEGSLVCGEGECKAGEFVWRPAGSRHDAWGGPQGGLMLAIFQIPNRFFEADGRETDVTGADWDANWGKALFR